MLCFLLPSTHSLYFNFPQFGSNTQNITYHGDAASSNRVIELTKNQQDVPINNSVGRAIYSQVVHMWDSQTGWLADFTTHFSFIINALNSSSYGDGLAFFLAANGSYIPPASGGGSIGLFSSNSSLNSTENQLVAVEFDTYMNEWDPSADHIGIDVNSIVSKANMTWSSSIKNGSTANAWVSYNSSTRNLSVFLTYEKNPVYMGNSSLYYIVDLREILPEWINMGFSAASTGRLAEMHQILSWDFNSTLDEIAEGGGQSKVNNKTGLIVGLVIIGAFVLNSWMRLLWYTRKKMATQGTMEVECVQEEGFCTKRFTYSELALATNNFSEDGKLGEGGFGGVYKGFLSELDSSVAVKKVSMGSISKKRKEEYISEINIIGQFRHRNLVQLLGWCHERGEFFLVYEFMPNGSLDSHLLGKGLLPWALRYKIARGLVPPLVCLHETWDHVHGNIKSSNVMLDSGFKAKLTDFGLVGLLDHELSSQTMVVAGTTGYLAPEVVTTGKASKESDVYSFGVVCLEIACGRRPVEHSAEPCKIRMVDWVWELYGRDELLAAADERLGIDFDEEQIKRLMVLGLWCAHPDHNSRPSMGQVMDVLSYNAPLPSLPSKMSVPMNSVPTTNMIEVSVADGTTSLEFSATALSDPPQTDM